jgi:hypothetical protein
MLTSMFRSLIQHRALRSPAAATSAALLAVIVISACGNTSTNTPPGNGPAGNTGPGSTATTVAPASAAANCTPWPGTGDLSAVAFAMRELADDENIYGPDSSMNNSAQQSVGIAESGLAQIADQLPNPYYQEIQDDVLSVSSSSPASDLDAAADNADSLATTLSQLCYTP